MSDFSSAARADIPFRNSIREPMIKMDWICLVAIILVGSVLYFPRLGARDLWNPNEPGYAEASREMMEYGNLIYPLTNGIARGEKPAPYYWLIIVSSRLLGDVTGVSSRLPSALCAVLLLLVTFVFARKFMPPVGSLVTTLVLATSFRFSWQARWAEPDMALALFVTLSMYFAFRRLCSTSDARLPASGVYLAAVSAALMKGPVGMAIPFLSVATFIASSGNRRRLALKRIEPLWGATICLLVLLPFYTAVAWSAGSGYMYDLLIHQNMARFFLGFDHRERFFYYLYSVMGDFAPFSAFLLAGLIWTFRKAKTEKRDDLRFLLCWFLTGLIFLSLSSSKREVYMLPLFPAAALMTGLVCEEWRTLSRLPVWLGELPARFTRIALVAVALGLVAFVANPFGSAAHIYAAIDATGFPSSTARQLMIPAAILSTAIAATAFWTGLRDRRLAFLLCVAGFGAAATSYVQIVVLPAVNPYKSARTAGTRIATLLPAGSRFGGFAPGTRGPWVDRIFLWDAYLFYSRRQIVLLNSEPELASYLSGSERKVVLMKNEDYVHLPEQTKAVIRLVEGVRVGHKSILVVSNLP